MNTLNTLNITVISVSYLFQFVWNLDNLVFLSYNKVFLPVCSAALFLVTLNTLNITVIRVSYISQEFLIFESLVFLSLNTLISSVIIPTTFLCPEYPEFLLLVVDLLIMFSPNPTKSPYTYLITKNFDLAKL